MNFDIAEIIRQKQQKQPKTVVLENGKRIILPGNQDDAVPPARAASMNANVRIATSADVGGLLSLLATYERSLPEQLRHGEASSAEILELVSAPNIGFVAAGNGDLAGCLFMLHRDETSALLVRLFVLSTMRGSGLGRALIEATIERGSTLGLRRLVLDTHPQALPEAYRLYKSLGFRECAPFSNEPYADVCFMERML